MILPSKSHTPAFSSLYPSCHAIIPDANKPIPIKTAVIWKTGRATRVRLSAFSASSRSSILLVKANLYITVTHGPLDYSSLAATRRGVQSSKASANNRSLINIWDPIKLLHGSWPLISRPLALRRISERIVLVVKIGCNIICDPLYWIAVMAALGRHLHSVISEKVSTCTNETA